MKIERERAEQVSPGHAWRVRAQSAYAEGRQAAKKSPHRGDTKAGQLDTPCCALALERLSSLAANAVQARKSPHTGLNT